MSKNSLAERQSGYTPNVVEHDSASTVSLRTLACNDFLFKTGETKTNLFRIETGALCVYRTRWDGSVDVIEFAFPGDLVGMGFLDHHACSARAMVATRVTCLPLTASDHLNEGGERAASRYKQAVDREFASRREGLLAAGPGRPAVRLAAFLIVLSRRNSLEGHDPDLIDGALECTVVADHLGLSMDLLAVAVAELKRRELVQPEADGCLRVNDRGALEALSNEAMTSLRTIDRLQ